MKQNTDIAIVGLGCRFPGGANHPVQFWDLIKSGISAVQNRSLDRYGVNLIKSCTSYPIGCLQKYDYREFDNQFFEMTAHEAEFLDPQQRMMMEVVHETLENAAISPQSISGQMVGVYIGLCHSDFQSLQFWCKNPTEYSVYSGLGSAFCAASGRVSRFYNFHGPSMTIDTACSASLVAIHQACLGLRHGDCDLALAGGTNAVLFANMSEYLKKLGVIATTINSSAFSQDADGYIRAEGCGMVALQRLEDAIRDRSRIFAVIRGSCVNHDGSSTSFTAPNVDAQIQLIQNTLKQCGLQPSDIGYLETHGTGTPLGDSTEIQALSQVFQECSGQKLRIGSVKTNIGHLEAAAGVAGLIKAALCLQHKTIPAHVSDSALNSSIDWENAPVEPVSNTSEWINNGSIRRAGVSSFGLTGTNAHVIVEEYQTASQHDENPVTMPAHLLVLSGKSNPALRNLAQLYIEYIQQSQNRLEDICYTAAVGRDHYEHLLAIVFLSKEELLSYLRDYVNNKNTNHWMDGTADDFSGGQHTLDFAQVWNENHSLNDVSKWIKQAGITHVTFSQPLMQTLKQEEYENALFLLSHIYITGMDISWHSFYPQNLNKVDVPLYPFQRTRFWNLPETTDTVDKTKLASSPITHPAIHVDKRLNGQDTILLTTANVLQCSATELNVDIPLSEQGFDSILGQELRHALETQFQIHLPSSFFYNYPTLRSMIDGIKHYQESKKQTINKSDEFPSIEIKNNQNGKLGFQHLDDLNEEELTRLIEQDLQRLV